jgi:hypothetical protein
MHIRAYELNQDTYMCVQLVAGGVHPTCNCTSRQTNTRFRLWAWCMNPTVVDKTDRKELSTTNNAFIRRVVPVAAGTYCLDVLERELKFARTKKEEALHIYLLIDR